MFFRKKPQPAPPPALPPAEKTYRERLEVFWDWFAKGAEEIHAMIKAREVDLFVEPTSEAVHGISTRLAWVYGPGNAPGEHSLTISGEGNPHLRLLCQHWADSSPSLPGWCFFPSRQPSPGLEGMKFSIGGNEYGAQQFWLTPEADEERELIHLTAWSPAFEHMESNDCWRVLFLWLDEALGEDIVALRLGKIEIGQGKLGESFPLTELPSFLAGTTERLGWRKWSLETYSQFRFHAPSLDYPRADLLVGQTTQPVLWQEYIESRGAMEDPLAGTGASYIFISIPLADRSSAEAFEERASLEDLIIADFRSYQDGRHLGAGSGQRNFYIDLLILDGQRTIERVTKLLRQHGAPRGTTLHPFAGDATKVLAQV